jgi:hypothetical protein
MPKIQRVDIYEAEIIPNHALMECWPDDRLSPTKPFDPKLLPSPVEEPWREARIETRWWLIDDNGNIEEIYPKKENDPPAAAQCTCLGTLIPSSCPVHNPVLP